MLEPTIGEITWAGCRRPVTGAYTVAAYIRGERCANTFCGREKCGDAWSINAISGGNMEKKELSRLHYLNKDIERERKQLQELEETGCSLSLIHI